MYYPYIPNFIIIRKKKKGERRSTSAKKSKKIPSPRENRSES